MALKRALAAAVCTGFLAFCGSATADEYRGSEVLGLDLNRAVMSPRRIGPDAGFAPAPIGAIADRGSDAVPAPAQPAAQAPSVSVADPQTAARKVAVSKVKVAQIRTEKPRVVQPRGVARVKLARRHGNPLDAQAADTRIQTWPCRSGGICEWQR